MSISDHHNAATDATAEEHVKALLQLGWTFKGRGLFPTWRSPLKETPKPLDD